MPNETLNFALPYPAPGDEPCDFAEQWCDFTEALDDVFDSLQETIDRTVPVVPVAIMRSNVSRDSGVGGGFVAFDEVVVDTARMTDMDVNPFQIVIPRSGRYTVGGFLEKPSSQPAVPPSVLVTTVIQPGVMAVTLDRGTGVTYTMTAYTPVASLNAGDTVKLQFNNGDVNDLGKIWVSWFADREVP